MVLWQEYENIYSPKNNGVKYVEIDENGTMLSQINSFDNAVLSYDCQPLFIDNKIVWYVNDYDGRRFYWVNGSYGGI